MEQPIHPFSSSSISARVWASSSLSKFSFGRTDAGVGFTKRDQLPLSFEFPWKMLYENAWSQSIYVFLHTPLHLQWCQSRKCEQTCNKKCISGDLLPLADKVGKAVAMLVTSSLELGDCLHSDLWHTPDMVPDCLYICLQYVELGFPDLADYTYLHLLLLQRHLLCLPVRGDIPTLFSLHWKNCRPEASFMVPSMTLMCSWTNKSTEVWVLIRWFLRSLK